MEIMTSRIESNLLCNLSTKQGLIGSRFERLPEAAITLLIQILNQYRGDFLRNVSKSVSAFISKVLYRRDLEKRFRFESEGVKQIKKEGHDSMRLAELCEIE